MAGRGTMNPSTHDLQTGTGIPQRTETTMSGFGVSKTPAPRPECCSSLWRTVACLVGVQADPRLARQAKQRSNLISDQPVPRVLAQGRSEVREVRYQFFDSTLTVGALVLSMTFDRNLTGRIASWRLSPGKHLVHAGVGLLVVVALSWSL